MKQIISVVALFAALAVTPASAGTIDMGYDHAEGCEMYSLYLSQPLAGKVGTFGYAATTSTNWSEAYAGLSYSPTQNISLSFGAGGQSGTSQTRYGGSVWAGDGKTSLLWLWEQGGGKWNKVVLKYQVAPKVSLGYVEKTYAGKGIYAEFALTENMSIKYHGFAEPQISFVKSYAF